MMIKHLLFSHHLSLRTFLIFCHPIFIYIQICLRQIQLGIEQYQGEAISCVCLCVMKVELF